MLTPEQIKLFLYAQAEIVTAMGMQAENQGQGYAQYHSGHFESCANNIRSYADQIYSGITPPEEIRVDI